MCDLAWTTERPAAPGWYWLKVAGEGPRMAYVYGQRIGGETRLSLFSDVAMAIGDECAGFFDSLEAQEGLWAGPLVPPSGV